MYQVVLLDPAWAYGNAQNGAADNHYATLSVKEICDLPCMHDGTVAKDALVCLWATTPNLLLEVPQVLDAWGADYKTALYWHKAPSHEDVFRAGYARGFKDGDYQTGAFEDADAALERMPKTKLGTGYWFRGEVEILVVAARKKFPALRSSRRNHHTEPAREHSAKPEWFQDQIDAAIAEAQAKGRLYPVNKLELFARRTRPGWRCEGLELTGHDHRTPLGPV